MTSSQDHTNRIEAYFTSCNNDSAADIAAHFTPDATIFDTNHRPIHGAAAIGEFWDRIRNQWRGAIWGVDRVIADGETAAIEWHMSGHTDTGSFVFRGSEHYSFEDELIAEIRQYWTFDRTGGGSELRGYPYPKAT